MEYPRLVYKSASVHLLTETAVQHAAALADGWFATVPDALAETKQAKQRADIGTTSDAAPPTRAELEQKAAELGIKFHANTGDKKLAEAIAAKLGVK